MNQAQEDKVKRYMDNTSQRRVLLMVDDEYYLASAPENCSDNEAWKYVTIARLPMPIQIVGLEDL